MTTMRQALLRASAILGLLLVHQSGALALATDEPPNIVVILADDLGWADTAVTGGRYFETPNLDRLAAQGIRFTQAYAAAHLCSPSRAAILTGRYPARVGITTVIKEDKPAPPAGTKIDKGLHDDVNRPLLPVSRPYFLPSTEITIPQMLHSAGYVSALVGKWHLGSTGSLPQDHGFDFNFGGNSWGRPPSYFDPYTSKYLKGRIGFSPRK